MTRATRTFIPKTRTTVPATSQNREGWPAWERPLPEQFLQTLLTNTVGRTFYADAKALLAEAHEVHDAMIATGDWAFIANALGYARQRGFMRLQPILGLVKLAQAAKDGKRAARVFFEKAFPEVVQTPNDLLDFMAVLKGARGNEGGRLVKRVAGAWLAKKFGVGSEGRASYWAVKYGAQKTEGYSLRDALRLYHPKSGPTNPVFAYLNGPRKAKTPEGQVLEDAKAWEEAVWAVPQIKAFERLKLVAEDAEKVKLITEGRLPHEVATPFAGASKDVWVAIAGQMPVFATLRHLATLERHDVLDATREVVEERLTDPETIARSRILPFRFLEAANHVRASWVQDALRQALELSFANVPEIAGTTAIMLDVSISMQGDYLQKAAIFAICAAKKAQGRVRFMLFSDDAYEFPVSLRDSILGQAQKIHVVGGTNTSACLVKLLKEKASFNNLLLVTDQQENRGEGFCNLLDEYRARVNPKTKCFILDVAPYRNAVAPGDGLTWWLSGWSDQALALVSMASGDGFEGMTEVVRNWKREERGADEEVKTVVPEEGMPAAAAPAGDGA